MDIERQYPWTIATWLKFTTKTSHATWGFVIHVVAPTLDPITTHIKQELLPRWWKAWLVTKPDRRLLGYDQHILTKTRPRNSFHGFGPYKYTSLPSNKHVRLLSLHPGGSEDAVSFDLTTHSLDSIPAYEALSYTWGKAPRTTLARCGQKTLCVGDNLYDALLQLRSEIQSRTLWCDGICINQEDLAERAAQVLLMRDIYSSALGVIIWLGNASKTSDRAIEVIRIMSDHYATAMEKESKPPFMLPAQYFQNAGLPDYHSPDWKAVDAIFWRAWFSRVWIIQELTLAKTATVVCGSEKMPWATIVQASLYTFCTGICTLLGIGNDNRIWNLDGYRNHHLQSGTFGLFGLLISSRRSIATDPRDHIYGRIGLATDEAAREIRVDYTLSVRQLYIATAAKILQHQGLDLLNSIPNSRWTTRTDLPSWVPDWSTYPGAKAFLNFNLTKPWAASAQSTPKFRFEEEHSSLMKIEGQVVDTVKSVGMTIVTFGTGSDGPPMLDIRELSALDAIRKGNFSFRLQTWEAQLAKLNGYANGEDLSMAFATTLIASQTLLGDAIPPLVELLEAFRYYWVRLNDNWHETIVEHADLAKQTAIMAYFQAFKDACFGRKFCITREGYMGIVPSCTRKGDIVVLLSGGRTPYLLRKRKNAQHQYLGECYVHGMMHGEKWDNSSHLTKFQVV